MAKKSKTRPGTDTNTAKSAKKQQLLEGFSRLEAQVQELQTQLLQAAQERAQLLGLVQQAAQERTQLQSQLDWVLYRLEQLNPEQMQSTLSQLSGWLTAGSTNQNYLSSEVGIDYNSLQNLLAKGKWRKADEETWNLILKAAGREDEGWLTPEDIQNFPCTDLRTIDWLWHEHSNGYFGFTAQQRVWESVVGSYTEFCDRVGWRVNTAWIYYDGLNFSIDAPEGHLPVIAWRRRSCYGVGKSTASESFSSLLSRLLDCAATT